MALSDPLLPVGTRTVFAAKTHSDRRSSTQAPLFGARPFSWSRLPEIDSRRNGVDGAGPTFRIVHTSPETQKGFSVV